jgi:hypothetical protein
VRASPTLPQLERYLTDVAVDEVLRLMRHK